MTGADPHILSFPTIDSTNSEAARQIQAGRVHQPFWIKADTQDTGRGRLGREWVSEKGNVFATLIWPAPELTIAPQLSFVTALAVQKTLKDSIGGTATVECKWPNDILMDGQKISGILLETAKDPHAQNWLIIGIGINLVSKPPTSRWPATFLGQLISPEQPEELIKRLHRYWMHFVAIWEHEGFAPIAEKWMECAFGLGTQVRYSVKDKTMNGIFEGLDASGAALVRLESGWVERIYAGEIDFSQGVGA